MNKLNMFLLCALSFVLSHDFAQADPTEKKTLLEETKPEESKPEESKPEESKPEEKKEEKDDKTLEELKKIEEEERAKKNANDTNLKVEEARIATLLPSVTKTVAQENKSLLKENIQSALTKAIEEQAKKISKGKIAGLIEALPNDKMPEENIAARLLFEAKKVIEENNKNEEDTLSNYS